jgi:hypothetical protein
MEKIMARAEYQEHFIASFGTRWRSMSAAKKEREWDAEMVHREKINLPVFPNPWRGEG